MINGCDEKLKAFIDKLSPSWREIWIENRDLSKPDENTFTSGAILFVGAPSLLCTMTAKTFSERGHWEYFPVYLKIVDENSYPADEWITLARAVGTSDFDLRVRWLFETPLLTLTEGIEEFRDGPGPDAKQYLFRFYNGLEISDPTGCGKLRLTASDMPDFVITAELSV